MEAEQGGGRGGVGAYSENAKVRHDDQKHPVKMVGNDDQKHSVKMVSASSLQVVADLKQDCCGEMRCTDGTNEHLIKKHTIKGWSPI